MNMEELLLQIIEAREDEKLEAGIAPTTAMIKEVEVMRDVQSYIKDKLEALVKEGKLKKERTVNQPIYAVIR